MIYLISLRKFKMEVTWRDMFEWNLEMFVAILKAGISYWLSQHMASSIFPWEIMPWNDHVKNTTLMKLWIRQGKNAEQFMNHINATGVVTIKSQATCDSQNRNGN